MEDFDETDDLRLSKKERLILMNQYRILEKLDPDEADFYRKMVTALKNGYEFNYYQLFDWIFDPMSREECKEVLDILQLFQSLQDSYKALANKSGIEEWRVNFQGFDGNNESGYMGFARFAVEQDGRYTDVVKNDQYNSHMPSLLRYRAMLERFRAIGSPQHPRLMNKESILKVIGQEDKAEQEDSE